MKTITAQQNDGMPYEVATAMLSEPRARLTNSFRKQCCRARETVVMSESPIRRHANLNVSTGDVCKGYDYTERTAVAPEIKTARRFRSKTLKQLHTLLRRAKGRRAVTQRRYLAVTDQTPHAEFVRAALSAIANRLDIIRDCAEDEIKRRTVL